MGAVNWTPAQKDAIDSRGYSIAVSAAAGSGKTAVLTRRIIERVCAEDGDISRVLVVTFTKEVRDAVVTLDEPYTSSEPIEVCVIAVNGEIPDDAQMTVEVTNNAKDASPVWEDATEAATSGWNHGFTNKVQKNGWAFNFRVTLHGGNTRGYITSVQGGFQ
jgi:hypothetical protein